MFSSLFPQRFGRYVLWPSSGVCRTREPSRNFELRPLLNPWGSPVLIQVSITGYKCWVFLYCYSPAVRIEPATFRYFLLKLREQTPITVTLCVLLDSSEWFWGTYNLNVLTWLGLLLCMIFDLWSYSDLFFTNILIIGSHIVFISIFGQITESELVTPVDSIKDVVRSFLKVAEFDKHLKKAGEHIGRIVVELTVKMKTIVRKPLMIKK